MREGVTLMEIVSEESLWNVSFSWLGQETIRFRLHPRDCDMTWWKQEVRIEMEKTKTVTIFQRLMSILTLHPPLPSTDAETKDWTGLSVLRWLEGRSTDYGQRIFTFPGRVSHLDFSCVLPIDPRLLRGCFEMIERNWWVQFYLKEDEVDKQAILKLV